MQHRSLESGKWAELSFMEQMANIGSEVSRTSKWKEKGNAERSQSAFYRALELIDLTLEYGRVHEKNRSSMLRELCRLREIFCEEYLSSDPSVPMRAPSAFSKPALATDIRPGTRVCSPAALTEESHGLILRTK